MYYLIFGLPAAVIFAALQVFLCRKTKKRIIRLVPLFLTAGIFASLMLLLTEPISAAFARYIDRGVFALAVYLTIGVVGSALGTAAGLVIYYVTKKAKKER